MYKQANQEEIFEDVLLSLGQPPMVTTLRIARKDLNDKEEGLKLAKEIIQKDNSNKEFEITLHPVVKDVIIVTKKKVETKIEKIEYNKESHRIVIVEYKCGMSVLRGANVFIGGIIALENSTRRGEKVSIFADTKSKILRGAKVDKESFQFGGDTGLVFVGNGVLQTTRKEIFSQATQDSRIANSSNHKRKLRKVSHNEDKDEVEATDKGENIKTQSQIIAIELTEPLFISPSFHGEIKDHFFAQNFPSTLVAHILNPQSGERILDLCSAPGGKTTHIASLMQDKGTIIAVEATSNRIKKLKDNITKYGFTNIQVFNCDALDVVLEGSENEKQNLEENQEQEQEQEKQNQNKDSKTNYSNQKSKRNKVVVGKEKFDRILLDAPCSGLGQRPSQFNDMRLSQLKGFFPYQKKIFERAVSLLKDHNGTLVYSTCTINPEENELLTSWALETFPHLRLVSQSPFVFGEPGFSGFGLTSSQQQLVQRFNPIHSDQTDSIGFYIAKFESYKENS